MNERIAQIKEEHKIKDRIDKRRTGNKGWKRLKKNRGERMKQIKE